MLLLMVIHMSERLGRYITIRELVMMKGYVYIINYYIIILVPRIWLHRCQHWWLHHHLSRRALKSVTILLLSLGLDKSGDVNVQ